MMFILLQSKNYLDQKIKIQFLNPDRKIRLPSQNTHWSDFLIGVTDREPTISGDLVGWDADVLS